MNFFIWIEETAFSTWLREGAWTFPSLLVLHAVGMAFLVGANLILDFRLLGAARNIALNTFLPWLAFIWWAFLVNFISGLLLLWAYPAKALTNPLFFVKLLLITVALWLTYGPKKKLLTSVDNSSHARVAFTSIATWLAAIFCGRLLAYTHTYLLVS